MVVKDAVGICRVLVTRPAGEASEATCAAVTAAGYEVYRQPLLELHGLQQLSATQRQMVLHLGS